MPKKCIRESQLILSHLVSVVDKTLITTWMEKVTTKSKLEIEFNQNSEENNSKIRTWNLKLSRFQSRFEWENDSELATRDSRVEAASVRQQPWPAAGQVLVLRAGRAEAAVVLGRMVTAALTCPTRPAAIGIRWPADSNSASIS